MKALKYQEVYPYRNFCDKVNHQYLLYKEEILSSSLGPLMSCARGYPENERYGS